MELAGHSPRKALHVVDVAVPGSWQSHNTTDCITNRVASTLWSGEEDSTILDMQSAEGTDGPECVCALQKKEKDGKDGGPAKWLV